MRSKLRRDLHSRARHFPNAASGALPRCPAGRSPSPGGWRWRGLPLRTIQGADSGFRRTYGIHPRLRGSASIRFAVRSLSEALDRERAKSGAWVGTSSTAERSPFPSRGRTIARFKVGETANVERDTFKSRRAKRCRAAGPRANAPIRSSRRGEAHRRPPLCGGGVGWRGLPLRTDSRRGQRLSADTVPSPVPREAPGSGLR